VHHTASATSLANPFPTQNLLRVGRVGLSGPLCNEAGPACTVDRPRLHVVAAHPANHAGASRASGPVPALSLYNPRSRGLEIDYAGTVPMLAGQLLVAHVWTRANADVLAGGNVEHVRAHAETSITGKWDPGYALGKTIDMAAFRRGAAALTAGGPAARSTTGAPDVSVRLVKAVNTGGPIYLVTELTVEASNDIALIDSEARANGVGVVDMHPAQIDLLTRSRADRRRALGLPAIVTGPDVDEEALAQHLAPFLAGSVDQLDDDDLARIADAAADEVDRRQRVRLG
jgi:hypothetical protein